jgi:hypothetical protein
MARTCSCCGIILGNRMSIKVTYRDGVFEPVENVTDVRPGQTYTAFSNDELADIRETIVLKTAEKSFEFWNDPDDAVNDNL